MENTNKTDGKTSTMSDGVTETQKIKYHYVVLNGGLSLATPNKERALKRISELYDLMKLERNKHWRVELFYGV